jgi:hypothetical protein
VGEVDHSVGVSPLVVVPGDDLDELRAEGDSGVGIEHGGETAGGEVLGDDGILGVAENSLHLVLGSILNSLLDGIVGGVLGEADGEVDDGDVRGGHSESHAGELAVQGRNNLADGLGGSGGGGDDVASSSTSSSPVFASDGGSINGQLVDGHGVDSGHETLLNSPGVVENLGDGGEAVGGAGSVGNNSHVAGVSLVVHADDEDGGVVLGRSRDDSLLGTSLDVETGLLLGGEDTSALSDVVGTDGTPVDGGGVLLVGDTDEVAINLDATISLLDGSLEAVCSMTSSAVSQ